MSKYDLALKVFRLQNSDYAYSNKLIEDVYSELNTIGIYEYYKTGSQLAGIFHETYTNDLLFNQLTDNRLFNISPLNYVTWTTPVTLGVEHGFNYGGTNDPNS